MYITVVSTKNLHIECLTFFSKCPSYTIWPFYWVLLGKTNFIYHRCLRLNNSRDSLTIRGRVTHDSGSELCTSSNNGLSIITGVSIVYSIVCSGADQRKHPSSMSLAFVRGMLPFDAVFTWDKCSYCVLWALAKVCSMHSLWGRDKMPLFSDNIFNFILLISYLIQISMIFSKGPSSNTPPSVQTMA